MERSVHAEYRTYLNNKDVPGFKPSSVNDVRVFHFLEEIYSLPAGNPIEPFEISEDIVRFLREQWAGLFQRLLQESSRQKEINLIDNLQNTASTLDHLVTFLTEERTKGDSAIKDILLSSHPAFAAIKKAAAIQYRVVFHSAGELSALLGARGYERDLSADDDVMEWDNIKLGKGIRVASKIFDSNDKLRVLTPEEWSKDYVTVYPLEPKKEEPPSDDAPF